MPRTFNITHRYSVTLSTSNLPRGSLLGITATKHLPPVQLPFPNADKFLRSLQKVKLKWLPPTYDLTCGMCHNEYGTGPDSEAMLRLPCNHHLGAACAFKWFYRGEANKNTCPFCKKVFFEVETQGADLDRDVLQFSTYMELLRRPNPRFDIAFNDLFNLLSELDHLRDQNVLAVTGIQPHAPEYADFHGVHRREPIITSTLARCYFEAFSRDRDTEPDETAVEVQICLGKLCNSILSPSEVRQLHPKWGRCGPDMPFLTDPRSHSEIVKILEKLGNVEETYYREEVQRFRQDQSHGRRTQS
ncbi:Ubiquitin-protein ligase [Lecanora helva]